MASVVRHGNSRAGVPFYGDCIMTPTRQPSDANMSNIRVHDWQTWQSFRSDRGAPPWIKVHRNLMTNAKWAALSDAEKGQLVSLWIAAADNEGVLPADPRVLRKICQLDENPNLEKLSKLGLIEGYDANVAPNGSQVDADMTHQIREDKIREEKSKQPLSKPSGSDYALEFEKVWKIYSRLNNTKKKKSFEKFVSRSKAGTLPEADKLIADINRQISEKQKAVTARKFVPEWPALDVWFNGDRWNDSFSSGPAVQVTDEVKQRRKEEMKAIEAKGYVFVGNNKWMDRTGKIIEEAQIERQ
jgi:hypothetical protein